MASVRKTAAKAEPEGTASAAPAEATLPEMTLEEVKKHASETDCFIAVDGLVCDVTEYLPNHPGSMEQLLDVAGEAGTAGGWRAHTPAQSAQSRTVPPSKLVHRGLSHLFELRAAEGTATAQPTNPCLC